MPSSLASDLGLVLAWHVKTLLQSYRITDVECEIRESKVLRSVGPKLLKLITHYGDPTRDVRISISTTLGQPISTLAHPWSGGTLGFFIQKGNDRSKLFCVTAHHVVVSNDEDNIHYHRTTTAQPACKVVLLGTSSYGQLLGEIRKQAENQTMMIELWEERTKRWEDNESSESKAQLIRDLNQLDDLTEAREAFWNFEKEVETKWGNLEDRVMGFKLLSPALALGVVPGGYTQDWAIIELDLEKVDATNLAGNTIDLGTKVKEYDLTSMMNTHLCKPQTSNIHWTVY